MIQTEQEAPEAAAEDRLFELHAAICKTFANPWRLRIVQALGAGELPVSRLVGTLGISKANVSQHLGIMREKGVVESRREGGHVYYRLVNPKVLEACQLMREVLLERLQEDAALSRHRFAEQRTEEEGRDERREAGANSHHSE